MLQAEIKQIQRQFKTIENAARAQKADCIKIKIGNEVLSLPTNALEKISKIVVNQHLVDNRLASPTRGVLNSGQFDALAKISRLRVGSDKYSAAYRHLVEGLTVPECARILGMSYQSAWTAIKTAEGNIETCRQVAGDD